MISVSVVAVQQRNCYHLEERHYSPLQKSWHSCATGCMASARQNNGNQWKETGMYDCTSQPSSLQTLCRMKWGMKFCTLDNEMYHYLILSVCVAGVTGQKSCVFPVCVWYSEFLYHSIIQVLVLDCVPGKKLVLSVAVYIACMNLQQTTTLKSMFNRFIFSRLEFSSDGQIIPYLLRNLNVNYHVHKGKPLDPILIHILTPYFLRIILISSPFISTDLPGVSYFQVYQTQFYIKLYSLPSRPHAPSIWSYWTWSSRSSLYNYFHLFLTSTFLLTFYLVQIWYSSPVLKHPQIIFFP
jgi:hypothetical protein